MGAPGLFGNFFFKESKAIVSGINSIIPELLEVIKISYGRR